MTGDDALTLRPATTEDRPFIMKVFAATRSDELAMLGDAALIETLVRMQFEAQQHSYSSAYPNADSSIVMLGDQPIGRMLVNRGEDAIWLVDIALLPEFRSRGTGSILLKQLIDEVAGTDRSLWLSVYKLNPAVRWYERHGFSKVAEDGLYIQMKWAEDSLQSSEQERKSNL